MQELIAFWKNSNPARPILCGTVGEWTEDGRVSIKEYGSGFAITPLLLLPKQAGMKKKEQLDKFEDDYRSELNRLNNHFANKLDIIFPEATPRGTAPSA